MATYLQWNARRALKPVAWVCGPEPDLAREVVAAYRGIGAADRGALFAADLGELKVWDDVLSAPPDGGRLLVVYGAEQLTDLAKLADLTGAGMDTAYTVFVDGRGDFPRAGERSRKLAPEFEGLQKARGAQLIRCCAPSREDDQVRLVASWWPGAGLSFGQQVLARCGGSLHYAYMACEKARRAQLEPTARNAGAVCLPPPGASVADALVAGDCKTAMAGAAALQRSDVGATLGLLASRLAMLTAIATARTQGMSTQEMPSKLHIDRFLLHLMLPHASAYAPARAARCRELLAVAESAYRSGPADGLLEAVAALW
jgi:hypothetical protein